jgi:hypothetical protein
MTRFVPLTLLVALSAPAAAQNMPLHQFVERGTKLEKKGPMALFHKGEINALMTEMKAAGAAVRGERLAAEKAGGKRLFCPPEKGEPMGTQKLLAELRLASAKLGPKATTTDGMRAMLVKRYPCPA